MAIRLYCTPAISLSRPGISRTTGPPAPGPSVARQRTEAARRGDLGDVDRPVIGVPSDTMRGNTPSPGIWISSFPPTDSHQPASSQPPKWTRPPHPRCCLGGCGDACLLEVWKRCAQPRGSSIATRDGRALRLVAPPAPFGPSPHPPRRSLAACLSLNLGPYRTPFHCCRDDHDSARGRTPRGAIRRALCGLRTQVSKWVTVRRRDRE